MLYNNKIWWTGDSNKFNIYQYYFHTLVQAFNWQANLNTPMQVGVGHDRSCLLQSEGIYTWIS